jgi:peroxiredoxin Q/BCP
MSKKMRKKSSKSPSRKATKSAAKKAGARKTSAGRTGAKKAASKKASAKKARAKKTSAKKATARKTTTRAKTPKKRRPATAPRAKASGGPVSAALDGLVEGVEAPAFVLPRDGGGQISLKDFAGQKLVLFFYPRADTPGCTLEAISFTRLADGFAEHGTITIGASADPVTAQESFKNKYNLTVPLASDEKRGMLHAYGVWGKKSMYGKTFEGILRTTFLIGPDGRIARIWRNVKVEGHAEDVLAAAQAL